MSHWFKINTDTGKFATNTEQMIYFNKIRVYKEQGINHAYTQLRSTLPRLDALDNYFYVLVGYITAQNVGDINYNRDDYDIVRESLIEEWLPSVRYKLTKNNKNFTRENKRKSLRIATREQKQEMINNIINWATGQGYKVPDAEQYNAMLEKEKNTTIVKDYFKDELTKHIKALTT